MVQYVFSRHSVRTITTLPPIFSSTFFLSQMQVKLVKISYFTSRRVPKLKPHFMGLFITYCFITDHSLNSTISSSTSWVVPFDTRREKLSLKCVISGLCNLYHFYQILCCWKNVSFVDCPKTVKLFLSLAFLCNLLQCTDHIPNNFRWLIVY